MELVTIGVALQALSLALLALLTLNGDAGRVLLVRLRSDGRADRVPDHAAEARRRQLLRALLGLFLSGTLVALVGLPRL